MKYITIASLLLFLISGNVNAQKADQRTRKPDPKESFLEAESYFLFEEYQEALPIYMRLLKLFPENDNLKYRIGICLLNDPYQKEESISYLEQATKNCAKDYKENSFKETRAPLDAWFYLGKAYLVNNRINEAIEAYSHFRKILDPKVYDANLVDEQIEACKNAIKLMKKPIDLDFINLGEPINSRFAETNPVVTHDETSMLFIRKLQFYDAVFYSRKVNGQWTEPENIMFDLGVDGDMYPCSLSADGTEAFFYSNDNYLGTIFTSKLVNGKWTKVRALNSNINTKYWESHACISADGTTLYFTSNRKGGFGGLDIYKSVRTPNGDWGPPVNLGPTVNTRYNEDTPFITEDGKTLYFSSYGHLNMGGYDINYTTLQDDGSWAIPVNAGYPINTTDNDLFFVPVKNGTFAYISRYLENNTLGRADIFRFEIYSGVHPRKFTIKGIIALPGKVEAANQSAKVYALQILTRDTVYKTTANAAGEYSITVPAGEYDLLINMPGYLPHIQRLLVPKDYKEGDIALSSLLKLPPEEKTIVPESKVTSEPPTISVRQNTFTLKQPGPVRIMITTGNAHTLDVNAYVDNRPVRSDLIPIEKKRFAYVYYPEPGLNIVVLTATGDNMQKVSDTVIINLQMPVQQEDLNKNQNYILEGKNLLDQLHQSGTENIRKAVQNIRSEKMGNPSARELAGYLFMHADSLGFSQEEFLISLAYLSAHMPLDELISRLQANSSGALRKELQQINPAQLGITEGTQLIDYLIEHAAEKGFTKQDVLYSLAAVAASDVMPGQQFIDKLSAFASGDNYTFLHNLRLPSSLNTIPSITDYLFKQAKAGGIPESDLQMILVRAASTYPMNEWLEKLIPFAEGNLRRFIVSVPSLDNKLYSPEQLVRYLLDHTAERKYTTDDLLEMFTAAAMSEQNNVAAFREILLHHSTNSLHATISNLDPVKSAIYTNQRYADTLLRLAPLKGYSESEFLKMLTSAAFEGDPDDHLYRIAMMLSADEAGKFLSVNLEKQGISSLEDLSKFMGSKKSPVRMNPAMVNQTVATYLASRQVEMYLRKMLPLTKGNLRYQLEKTDPYKLGLSSVPELIDHLFKQAPSAGYSEDELFQALEKTDDRLMLERAWNRMVFQANDTLADFIRENHYEIIKKYSRSEYFNYITESFPAGKTDDIRKVIAGSISGSQEPAAIYDRMLSMSMGSLKNLLQQAQTKKLFLAPSFPENFFDSNRWGKSTTGKMFELYLKAIASLESNNLFSEMQELADPSLKGYLSARGKKELTFDSRNHLLESLFKASSGQEFDNRDAGILIGRIHERMLAENILENFRHFVQQASGTAAAPQEEEIINIRDLFINILENGKAFGLSPDKIHQLFLAFHDETELDWFREKLSVYAEGALRNTLDRLIRSGQPFKNAYDLVEWLYTNAPANGYSREDVVHLLVRIINDMLQNLLARITEIERMQHKTFPVVPVAGALLLTALIIFLLLAERKRRKKKTENSSSIG